MMLKLHISGVVFFWGHPVKIYMTLDGVYFMNRERRAIWKELKMWKEQVGLINLLIGV